jgi:hypothetical protein
MENERLLVWLALVPEGAAPVRSGVLCRRHADAMIVPRGWTLDDRRESMPRLFKVADPSDSSPTRQSRQTTNHPSRGRAKPRPQQADADPPLQLVFGEGRDDAAALSDPDLDAVADDPIVADRPDLPEVSVPAGITVGDILPAAAVDPDETRALPWRPVFDADDDLDGLLNANSPLLARAFRTRNARSPEPT